MASLRTVEHAARFALRTALDGLLPPRCGACDAPVDAPGRLCASCWRDVTFIGEPLCLRCGMPFELGAQAGSVCGACMRAPPAFDRARAAVLYQGVGRDLVLAFKMADRTWLAPVLSEWMARAGAELLADAAVIVPVPLHRWRLLSRRYNQSAMLALAIAERAGVPCVPDALMRVRATPSQARLSAAERRRNVRGAFRVRSGRRPAIEDRRVLLIDDVMTTGATAAACAQALCRAGAAAVDVLTLARTADRAT